MVYNCNDINRCVIAFCSYICNYHCKSHYFNKLKLDIPYGKNNSLLLWYKHSTVHIAPTHDNEAAHLLIYELSSSCPPVRGDNPRASARGLSYVQVDKHGITIVYHLHQCRHFKSRAILCLRW